MKKQLLRLIATLIFIIIAAIFIYLGAIAGYLAGLGVFAYIPKVLLPETIAKLGFLLGGTTSFLVAGVIWLKLHLRQE